MKLNQAAAVKSSLCGQICRVRLLWSLVLTKAAPLTKHSNVCLEFVPVLSHAKKAATILPIGADHSMAATPLKGAYFG